MAENIKEHVAKIKAIIGKEAPQTVVETTTETTTRADLEDVPEYPLNQD
jgi:hypothetical protein